MNGRQSIFGDPFVVLSLGVCKPQHLKLLFSSSTSEQETEKESGVEQATE